MLLALEALRMCCSRVDVLAFASPGEDALADPRAILLPRPQDPPLLTRLVALRYGSAYFSGERRARLGDQIRSLTTSGALRARYDVLWVYKSLMATSTLENIAASVRILDIDHVAGADRRSLAADPEIGTAKRIFRRISALAIEHEERRRSNHFDRVIVLSDPERDRLGAVSVPVEVIPNGTEECPQMQPAKAGPRMLFVGSLDYKPNIDAVRWLAADILPQVRRECPSAELVVVGRNPSEDLRQLCSKHSIELAADVPDLEPFYLTACVVLAPIRIGIGVLRIKLMEALAYGAPIVATPIAAEGVLLEDGRNAYIATEAEAFAHRCVELLRDPALAGAMGAAARATWKRHYHIDRPRQQIISLVATLTGSKRELSSDG